MNSHPENIISAAKESREMILILTQKCIAKVVQYKKGIDAKYRMAPGIMSNEPRVSSEYLTF
jgi:hypothetical protein